MWLFPLGFFFQSWSKNLSKGIFEREKSRKNAVFFKVYYQVCLPKSVVYKCVFAFHVVLAFIEEKNELCVPFVFKMFYSCLYIPQIFLLYICMTLCELVRKISMTEELLCM